MTVWTEDRVDLLKRRVGEGVSYTDIGIEIGVARGAIAGKVTRLGIGRGAPAQSRSSRAINKPRGNPNGGLAFKAANGTLGRKTVAPRPPRPVPMTPIEDLVVPISLSVSLLALNDSMCKWPFGDGPFLFCGHRSFDSLPYCEYHSRLAYQPVNDRQHRQDARRA